VGELILFPCWRVETRDEGSAPGEPRFLVDPRGKRIPVEDVVRRTLIAASDPQVPVRHETIVRAGGRLYALTFTEGGQDWHVRPA